MAGASESGADRAGNGGTVPPPEHRFKPGVSGNPGGKPKGASVMAALLRKLAEHPNEHGEGARAVKLADELYALCENFDPEDQAAQTRLRAILAVVERTDGKVVKEIAATVQHTLTRVVVELPEGERPKVLQAQNGHQEPERSEAETP